MFKRCQDPSIVICHLRLWIYNRVLCLIIEKLKNASQGSSMINSSFYIAVWIVIMCNRAYVCVDTFYICLFLSVVHFVTVDLYRYEFANWCSFPAKAVGEGCVGIEPIFVRRCSGKCITFQSTAMLGIYAKFQVGKSVW